MHINVEREGREAKVDESERHELVKKYARLKKKKTDIDNEISQIRKQIVDYCVEQNVSSFESGRYRIKLVHQERKEYDDQKLFDALPDPSVWKMISKADSTKINSLINLNILTPSMLKDSYQLKQITLLQVEKQ